MEFNRGKLPNAIVAAVMDMWKRQTGTVIQSLREVVGWSDLAMVEAPALAPKARATNANFDDGSEGCEILGFLARRVKSLQNLRVLSKKGEIIAISFAYRWRSSMNAGLMMSLSNGAAGLSLNFVLAQESVSSSSEEERVNDQEKRQGRTQSCCTERDAVCEEHEEDEEDDYGDCFLSILLFQSIPSNIYSEIYSDDLIEENSDVFISPNGTKLWVPKVDETLKPVVGSSYTGLVQAYNFYKSYAHACGFNVRIGQQKKCRIRGCVVLKYFRCNRSGKPQSKKKFDSSTSCRQSTYKRNDCQAHVLLRFCPTKGVVSVIKFSEGHNHSLVEGFNTDLSKISRKLSFSTQKFIHNMSLNSVGPVKAHRYMVSMMGGHHNVNGTPMDFKNFSKNTRMFIGDRDSQLVLNRLNERARMLPDFYLDYLVVEGKLRCLFWADEISKINYEAFGDVLAFDATYQTNKYSMVFVPFTGVDNHRRCVTFGAGLLFNETTESYTWLLKNFLKAHKKEPMLVLTDQDNSMRAAVLAVFTEAKHKLCMWHIMKKLPSKIKGDLLQNTDVRAQLHRLVWSNYMKTSTFERKWGELIQTFGLGGNDWLAEMYGIRERWIPAYFRDVPMSCLLKTTSVCESSNAAFKVSSTSAHTLVQFMLCFETRLESQRYKQRAADFKTSSISYRCYI
ncbi:hypothetical protein SSX86_022726 [Deinandra increscens subsp. villosa]|uniref:Protein FAR1-RELATED SEQUENCE n=1 Tax=Deinandra increscens subsp. villosa TaxID=3103831 RepID=A0AAP0CPH6_9ASTR